MTGGPDRHDDLEAAARAVLDVENPVDAVSFEDRDPANVYRHRPDGAAPWCRRCAETWPCPLEQLRAVVEQLDRRDHPTSREAT